MFCPIVEPGCLAAFRADRWLHVGGYTSVFVGIRKGDGSPGQVRTADRVVNSHLLYRLSYRGSEERQILIV